MTKAEILAAAWERIERRFATAGDIPTEYEQVRDKADRGIARGDRTESILARALDLVAKAAESLGYCAAREEFRPASSATIIRVSKKRWRLAVQPEDGLHRNMGSTKVWDLVGPKFESALEARCKLADIAQENVGKRTDVDLLTRAQITDHFEFEPAE